MKQKYIKILACLLACLMLGSALVSCKEEPEESTEAPPESAPVDGESTEPPSDTTATEATSEQTSESSTQPQYTPVELESKIDLVPNYEPYEILTKDRLDPAFIQVEGEDYSSSTLWWEGLVVPGEAQSGGEIFYGVNTPEEWERDPDSFDWNKPLTVSYKVKIPYTGYYTLLTKTGDLNQVYTTNFSLVIDNNKTIVASDCEIAEEVPSEDSHRGVFQIVDMGAVYLTEGDHIFKFVLDVQDAYKDRDEKTWPYGRIAFLMDYFSLSRVYSDNDMPKMKYDVDISGDKNAELLKSATNVYVFDERYPIRIDYVHFFSEAGTGNYTITDYDGNVVYRKYFNGEKNDIRRVEIGIKDHPTGYFKLQAGEYVVYYVVTPSVETRTETNTRFAMDFASTSFITDPEKIGYYSSALRMIGVTWVRDRMAWGLYQTDYQNGVSTFNESYMNELKQQMSAIDEAGLNIILMMSGAPNWANRFAAAIGPDIYDKYETSDPDKINAHNVQFGYYGTQLGIYDGTKKIAQELGDIVEMLELGNEPDLRRRDLPETYSGWFKAAALGIIDSGSNMMISVSGMCKPTNEKDYFGLMMGSDVLKYSSIFNYHSHSFRYPGSDTVLDFEHTLNAYLYTTSLELYGVEKPIWITEAGLKLPSETPTDAHKETQAPYLITSTVQSLSHGTDKHFWFVAAPYTEAGGDFGSFTAENQPYPTIAAHAIMTDVLGKANYIGELKNLPKDTRGYLFDNGERVVAVIWRTSGEGTYTFNADMPVIRTSMMGEEKLINPNDKGTITVNVSSKPIYITYSAPPTDYYQHSFSEPETLKVPEVSFGDRVIITPEFADYIFDYDSTEIGHKVQDGTVINVRVVNLNTEAITGKVSVSIPGFTVNGLDTEITVLPQSEGYITLTLTKTSDVAFDDHVTFTGTFNGQQTSPTAIHVYSVQRDSRPIVVKFDRSLMMNSTTDPKILKNVSMTINNFVGDIQIKINEDEFTKFTFVDNNLVMDLSELAPGKYYIYIGCITEGGDQQVVYLSLRYDGETVRFGNQW